MAAAERVMVTCCCTSISGHFEFQVTSHFCLYHVILRRPFCDEGSAHLILLRPLSFEREFAAFSTF